MKHFIQTIQIPFVSNVQGISEMNWTFWTKNIILRLCELEIPFVNSFLLQVFYLFKFFLLSLEIRNRFWHSKQYWFRFVSYRAAIIISINSLKINSKSAPFDDANKSFLLHCGNWVCVCVWLVKIHNARNSLEMQSVKKKHSIADFSFAQFH